MKLNLALDAIDELYQTTVKSKLPYGGKVLLLGGDFRQCLPVVKHGNRVQVTEASNINNRTSTMASFQTNSIGPEHANRAWKPRIRRLAHQAWKWNSAKNTKTQQPRAHQNTTRFPLHGHQYDWAWLWTSDSTIGWWSGWSDLQPSHFMSKKMKTVEWATITSHQRCRDLSKSQTTQHDNAFSIVTMDSEDQEEIANYPAEISNTFDVSGLPTHELQLKVGAIVILLKNIDSRQGLCNGTRLLITFLTDNVIVATIAAGKNKGWSHGPEGRQEGYSLKTKH